jgi:hypothetical protein
MENTLEEIKKEALPKTTLSINGTDFWEMVR